MPRKAQLEAAQERHRVKLTDAKEVILDIDGTEYTVALTHGSYELEGQRTGGSEQIKVLSFLLSKKDHPASPEHGVLVTIVGDATETGKYTLDFHRNQGNHWLCKASL